MRNGILGGVVWSISGYAVLAVSGIAFNVLLTNHYGVVALGVFNQAYSLYILLSMVVAFGVQLSSLHHVSKYFNQPDVLKEIITSGLAILLVWGSLITIVSFLISPLVGVFFESESVQKAFLWILPGIYFFGLNKYLLNTINGLFEIRKLAVLQSLRFVLASIFLIILTRYNLPMEMITSCLSASEFLIFIFSLIMIAQYVGFIPYTALKKWAKKHINFGVRAFPGGVVSEANTRIDILMIGLFLGDRIVGIYSIAALAAEGLIQVVDVLRFPFNPYLSKFIAEDEKSNLEKLIKKGTGFCYFFVFFLVLLGYVVFEPLIQLVFTSPDISGSKPIFIVFLAGILISGGYRPFVLLLSQAGLPGEQTKLMLLITISNICLNAIMIPLFGIIGAACGTSIAMILQALFLKWFVGKNLQITI